MTEPTEAQIQAAQSAIEQAMQQSMDAARMSGSSKLHREAAEAWRTAAARLNDISALGPALQAEDAAKLELSYADAIDGLPQIEVPE